MDLAKKAPEAKQILVDEILEEIIEVPCDLEADLDLQTCSNRITRHVALGVER